MINRLPFSFLSNGMTGLLLSSFEVLEELQLAYVDRSLVCMNIRCHQHMISEFLSIGKINHFKI